VAYLRTYETHALTGKKIGGKKIQKKVMEKKAVGRA
jgi:hypothetical protein